MAKLSMNEANYVALHENNFPSFFFVKDELARGRVDICYNGSYESVCSDTWKEEEASVICQQLGFSKYGKGSSRVNIPYSFAALNFHVLQESRVYFAG